MVCLWGEEYYIDLLCHSKQLYKIKCTHKLSDLILIDGAMIMLYIMHDCVCVRACVCVYVCVFETRCAYNI